MLKECWTGDKQLFDERAGTCVTLNICAFVWRAGEKHAGTAEPGLVGRGHGGRGRQVSVDTWETMKRRRNEEVQSITVLLSLLPPS